MPAVPSARSRHVGGLVCGEPVGRRTVDSLLRISPIRRPRGRGRRRLLQGQACLALAGAMKYNKTVLRARALRVADKPKPRGPKGWHKKLCRLPCLERRTEPAPDTEWVFLFLDAAPPSRAVRASCFEVRCHRGRRGIPSLAPVSRSTVGNTPGRRSLIRCSRTSSAGKFETCAYR